MRSLHTPHDNQNLHHNPFPSDVDECASTPCHNGGSCTDGVDSYVCTCDAVWEGDNCDLSKSS